MLCFFCSPIGAFIPTDHRNARLAIRQRVGQFLNLLRGRLSPDALPSIPRPPSSSHSYRQSLFPVDALETSARAAHPDLSGERFSMYAGTPLVSLVMPFHDEVETIHAFFAITLPTLDSIKSPHVEIV